MARTDTLPHFLTDVADAIREKTGSTDLITASDFDTEIENIPSGGEESTEEEMRMFDLAYIQTHPYRPYSEDDYTQAEIDKVDDLLNKLEGDDNNG